MRRPMLWLVVLGAIVAIGGRVGGRNQAQNGGRLLCVGPPARQYFALDTDGDGELDATVPGGAGTAGPRGCAFSFDGPKKDDRDFPWCPTPTGHFWLEDPSHGVVLHARVLGPLNLKPKPQAGWSPCWPSGECLATVREGDGFERVADHVEVWVATGRWAIVDRTAPRDARAHQEWPHQPLLREGYGDLLRVELYDDAGRERTRWVGVVECPTLDEGRQQ
jgi:hypothetical protein